MSGKNEVKVKINTNLVKVHNFLKAAIKDIPHSWKPILERYPGRLILHVRTSNAESITSRQILQKLLKLKLSSVKSVFKPNNIIK